MVPAPTHAICAIFCTLATHCYHHHQWVLIHKGKVDETRCNHYQLHHHHYKGHKPNPSTDSIPTIPFVRYCTIWTIHTPWDERHQGQGLQQQDKQSMLYNYICSIGRTAFNSWNGQCHRLECIPGALTQLCSWRFRTLQHTVITTAANSKWSILYIGRWVCWLVTRMWYKHLVS